MPQVGWEVDGVRYTLEEALNEVRENGHFFRYPRAHLLAVHQDVREAERVSPSSADGCQRAAFLLRDYDYWIDLEKQWASAQGQALHAWYEEAAPDHVETEITLSYDFEITLEDGTKVKVPVSGTVDEYDSGLLRITDYKTIGWFRKYSNFQEKWLIRETPSMSNVIQINLYRWLCEKHGRPVDEMFLWYVKRGDSKGNPRRMVKAPLIPNDKLEAMLYEMAYPIAEAIAYESYPEPIPEGDADKGWICHFCPVEEICRGLEKEGR